MTDPNTTPANTTPADPTPADPTAFDTESTATTTPFFPVSKPSDAPEAPATPAARKRRPLFPTILWGAMMLALACFIAAGQLVPGGLDVVTWLLTAAVGIGLLLVVAGGRGDARRAG
jgi:peptidoglycan/LPS O-acetylase OafA/YrhL